jgi:phage-related minor tail protein
MKTRNVLRGMTDQGVNVGQREYHRGEGYSYSHGFGEQYKTAAYLESQKAAREAAGSTVASAHAFGGIFRRHHVAHVAESGPEAIIPLSRGARARSLLNAASRMVGGGVAHSTSVNFAPNITIHGGASEKEQAALDTKLRDLARDFVAQFKHAQSHERRLSYEGGYG